MSALLSRELINEYGVDLLTEHGRKNWLRVTTAQKIVTPGHYAAVCRRLAQKQGLELRVDGRLIAAGWNHVTPREWICDGGSTPASRPSLAKFVAYWNASVARPMTVGSPYNPSPEKAFAAMQSGIRPEELRLLGEKCVGSHRPLAKKRKLTLYRAAKAQRRISEKESVLPIKTLAVLGRLSPELQRVALFGFNLKAWSGNPHLRVRELNWKGVAVAQEAIRQDASGRVRIAYMKGQRQLAELMVATGSEDMATLRRWLCPSYPTVCIEIGARITRGESPVFIAAHATGHGAEPNTTYALTHDRAILTRAEAHGWLSDGAPFGTMGWYVSHYLAYLPVEQASALRSWTVVRWLRAVKARGQWSVLLAPRMDLANGVEIHYTYLDRLDEIQDQDLTAGAATGVNRAFENCQQRKGAAWLQQALRDHAVLAPLPAGWRPYSSMTLLNTRALLAAEGRALEHCVGGYDGAVERKQSVIFGVRVGAHRSTIEFDLHGNIRQHHGSRNETPHALCVRVVERFARRIGRTQ